MGVGVRVIELPDGRVETVMDLDSLYELIREYMGNDVVEFIEDSMESEAYNKVNNIITHLIEVKHD